MNTQHGPHLVRYGGRDNDVVAAILGADAAMTLQIRARGLWRRSRGRHDTHRPPGGHPRGHAALVTRRPPDYTRPSDRTGLPSASTA